jgi:NHL repeat-containing protein
MSTRSRRKGAPRNLGRSLLVLAIAVLASWGALQSTASARTATTLVRTFGGHGTGDGQLQNPGGLGIGPSGDVYAADAWNNRIEEFTQTGSFVRTFGSGTLSNPEGVAFGPNGDAYVADTNDSRVVEFTSTGAFVRTFGGGTLFVPAGLAVGGDGSVYVADAGNNRVAEFTAPATSSEPGEASARRAGSSTSRTASRWLQTAPSGSPTPRTTRGRLPRQRRVGRQRRRPDARAGRRRLRRAEPVLRLRLGQRPDRGVQGSVTRLLRRRAARRDRVPGTGPGRSRPRAAPPAASRSRGRARAGFARARPAGAS